jgi:hypothetical protein
MEESEPRWDAEAVTYTSEGRATPPQKTTKLGGSKQSFGMMAGRQVPWTTLAKRLIEAFSRRRSNAETAERKTIDATGSIEVLFDDVTVKRATERCCDTSTMCFPRMSCPAKAADVDAAEWIFETLALLGKWEAPIGHGPTEAVHLALHRYYSFGGCAQEASLLL